MLPFARLQRLFPFLAWDLDFEAGGARAVGGLPQGQPWHQDRDLIGQGLGKITAAI